MSLVILIRREIITVIGSRADATPVVVPRTGDDAASLGAILTDACSGSRRQPRRAIVLLSGGVCEVRRITTPPLSRRNAGRFVAAQSPAIFLGGVRVRTAVAPAGAKSRGTVWIAAAARTDVINAVTAPLRAAGIRRIVVAPVHEVLALHASQMAKAASGHFHVAWDGVTEQLDVRKRRLIDASPTAASADTIAISDVEVATAARRHACSLAFADPVPAVSSVRRRLVFATALLLLSAALGVMEQHRVARELVEVAEARARISDVVARAAAERAALESELEQLDALHRIAGAPARSPWLLARIAAALPEPGYLTRLELRGDTILIDGVAPSARSVFESFSGVGAFSGARLTRQAQRVQTQNGAAELFQLQAGAAP